jgi:hypothetical protein
MKSNNIVFVIPYYLILFNDLIFKNKKTHENIEYFQNEVSNLIILIFFIS